MKLNFFRNVKMYFVGVGILFLLSNCTNKTKVEVCRDECKRNSNLCLLLANQGSKFEPLAACILYDSVCYKGCDIRKSSSKTTRTRIRSSSTRTGSSRGGSSSSSSSGGSSGGSGGHGGGAGEINPF